MAKSRPLDVKGQRGFKILILNEVDRLSREAQHSLRRTMEKYSSACRLVLACSNISKARPLAHPYPPICSPYSRNTANDPKQAIPSTVDALEP